MVEETLGDILAAALAAPEHSHDPHASPDDQHTFGALRADVVADEPIEPRVSFNAFDLAIALVVEQIEAERQAAERIASRAMVAAGERLAADLAPLINCSADEAFDCLGHMPDAMLAHLQSPQGWMILAGYVAADLGVAAPAYTPAVH